MPDTEEIRLFVADTETTGLIDPIYICELGWALIDWDLNVEKEFASLVKPPINIPCSAAGVHGIRTAMVQDSPMIEDLEFPGGPVILIGHNIRYDRKLLSPHMNIVGQGCTLTLARRLLPDAPDYKLSTLSCYCDLPLQLNHRAMNDVRDCLALLDYLQRGTGWTLEELINYSNTPIRLKTMPWGKHKGLPMEQLPGGYVKWLSSLDDLDIDMTFTLQQIWGISL